jgi:transposase-like protein
MFMAEKQIPMEKVMILTSECNRHQINDEHSKQQVHAWKRQLLEQGSELFNQLNQDAKARVAHEAEQKVLYVLITVRQIKYLNNIVEQDHRFVKKIIKPMKEFKTFHSAEATLAGIELHHMLRKGQYNQPANETIFEQFYRLAA